MATKEIYLDGKWVGPDQAKLSVYDHGVLYGDGVFEGLRAYDGSVFKFQQHLDRLYRSADLISLVIPMEKKALGDVVNEALRRNGLRDAYIRLLVTRGAGDLGLDPRACPTPSIVVIADKLALFPAECYRDGLKAIIAKTRRNIPEAINPVIKSMNYLNNILAKIEATAQGVPEAIMLNRDGFVAECTGDNIFVVKGGDIVTPPTSAGALEGITRAAVMDLIKKEKDLTVREGLFKPEAFFEAEEIFFTGTAAEVIPVTEIEGKKIGSGQPGPITARLIDRFKALTKADALGAAAGGN